MITEKTGEWIDGVGEQVAVLLIKGIGRWAPQFFPTKFLSARANISFTLRSPLDPTAWCTSTSSTPPRSRLLKRPVRPFPASLPSPTSSPIPPASSFVYQSTAPNQVRVYSVDLSTGYFNEVSGSPFTAPVFGLPIAFSVAAGSTQPVVTVSNSGNAPASITAVILGGSNPTDFSAPSTTCIGMPLLPNTSCIVSEIFTPSAVGVRQAALIFTDNASGNPQSVALIGTGINSPPSGPALKFLPTSVTFPITTQGLASTPVTVAITNTGTTSMHVSNISAGGNSPADFTNSLTSCTTATIAPNTSCTVSITFSPIFSGPRSETLSVTDDAPNSPQVLNIFANAAPAFSITSASTALSATVSAGQSATYALQLTPGLDYNGTISFTCTGAPLGATCQAPATVVLNVGAPQHSPLPSLPAAAQCSLQESHRADRRAHPPHPARSPLHSSRCSLFWFCVGIAGETCRL